MARRRTGEMMAIADEATREFVLQALEDRLKKAGEELIWLARKDEEVPVQALVDQARRLIAGYDAWLQAGGAG